MVNVNDNMAPGEPTSGPAAPVTPQQAPAGPNPFAIMLMALEAEARENETTRQAVVRQATERGEDTQLLEQAHARQRQLEADNVQLRQSSMALQNIAQMVAYQEMDKAVRETARQYGLDEAKLRQEFARTKQAPSDLELITLRMRLDQTTAEDAGYSLEELPTVPTGVIDSGQASTRRRNLDSMTPEELLRLGLEDLDKQIGRRVRRR